MGVVRIGRRRLAMATLVTATFLLVGLVPGHLDADASERTARTPSTIVPRSELGDDLLALTNADRATGGREAVRLAERLSRYAVRHSRRMAELGSIFHSGERQLRDALEGTGWETAGENVGVGASVRGVQRAFMASPPHRANILGPSFDHAAVGVVRAGGVVWVTVVFYGD
jgi:uncharacterized protein YkwD